jgi:FG-GAP-like repeat/Abnormal spindle-like microcephaly-assoc'd, ASPM-SPD-2-Hydin
MKSVPSAFLFMLLVCALGWAQIPIPLINQPMVPASVAPGSGAFTLTVNGTGFTTNSVVYWNGSLRPTAVVSSSTVQAQIGTGDIAKPGFGWVTVGNLGAVEVQSNVIYFPIRTSAEGVGFLTRNIQNVVNPGPIAVGDFNNDGLLDFAVGGGTTGNVQVFLGKGNGTFQLPITTVSAGVYAMVAGDFNGDGKLDLAVANKYGRYGTRLNVFLGQGNGKFTKLKGAVFSSQLGRLLTADFNGDGKLDLYIDGQGTRRESEFGILFGHGDGTFDNPFLVGPLPRGGYGGPAFGDFNRDGNLDLAVAGTNYYGKSVVEVFLSGSGLFDKPVTYLIPFGGESLAAADLNGDGKLDLITDGVSVLLGNGDGTFRKAGGIASGGTGSVNLGDFNGDGKLDVMAGLSLLLGSGDGKFQKPLTFAGMGSGSPASMSAFDANGNLDVLAIDALNGAVSIFEQRSLYFTPTNLDFGSVMDGTTSPPQGASVTNVAANKLTVTVNITGANAGDFAQTNDCGTSLPPEKTCKIRTTFTPSLVGSESASLNVTYPGSAPLSMPLSGVGTIQTRTVTLTPSSLTFALQLVGTTSQDQQATLTNTGNQSVRISNIATGTPFSQGNNCPSTLAAGASCLIGVEFAPTDKGMVNGTLSVSDDAVGSPQTVALSGTGTAVVFSPTGINFGNEKVGTKSVPVPIRLSNLGTSALSISQIAIKGTDPNDFAQTNNCGSSVPPQSKCTITVTFTPTAKGSRSANVSITDNDPSSPQTVPLSGNGT